MHIRRRLLAPTLLVSVLVSAAVSAIEPAAPANQPSAVSAADAAYIDHVGTVVAGLQSRNDSAALLSRAVLGWALALRRPCANDHCTNGVPPDSHAVTAARLALHAADADAHVLYRIAANSGGFGLSGAERASAIKRLLRIDGDNLAVRMLALSPAAASDPEQFDAWLATAAASTRLDFYLEATMRTLVDALASLPAPEPMLRAHTKVLGRPLMGPEPIHMLYANSVALAMAVPAFSPLVEQCAPERANAWSLQRQQACLRIARVAALHSNTQVGQSIGLAMWQRLSTDATDTAALRQAQRDATWLREQSLAQIQAQGELATLPKRLAAYRAGVSEIEFDRSLLREAGIPLRAPER